MDLREELIKLAIKHNAVIGERFNAFLYEMTEKYYLVPKDKARVEEINKEDC